MASNEDLVKIARTYPHALASVHQLVAIEQELRRRGSDWARIVRGLINAIELPHFEAFRATPAGREADRHAPR